MQSETIQCLCHKPKSDGQYERIYQVSSYFASTIGGWPAECQIVGFGQLESLRQAIDCNSIDNQSHNDRECVHLVTPRHFRSRDKDGGHTIRGLYRLPYMVMASKSE